MQQYFCWGSLEVNYNWNWRFFSATLTVVLLIAQNIKKYFIQASFFK